MKRTWTIIGVANVARSLKWYQSLFGQPETSPAHDYFGQILDTDGTVLHTSIHPWLAQSIRNLATDYFCSFVWMTLMRHCLGPALSSPHSKTSPT